MKSVVKIIKIGLPILLIGFLLRNIARDWQTVVSFWQDFNLFYFLLAIPFFLVIYPEAAVAWHVLLRAMGVKIRLDKSLRIWIISNTSRYIPGKIWQYVGRVELARQEGIPRNKTLTSLLAEIFLVLNAGIFVSALSLPFLSLDQVGARLWIFLLPAPLVLLHPAFANKIIPLIAKFSKKKIDFDVSLGIKDTLSSFPWFILNFLLNGAALLFLVSAITQSFNLGNLVAFSGFFALSWVLGFISLFAPAGLGVTEISLAYLLSFSMPLSLASAVALFYRVFLTIAELLVFLFVLRIKK